MHHNKSATPPPTLSKTELIDKDSLYRLRSMAEHMEAFFRCMPAIKAIHITARGSDIDTQVDGTMTPERRTTVMNSIKVAARSSGCLLATNPSCEPGIAPYQVLNADIENVLSRTFTAGSVWESMRAAFPTRKKLVPESEIHISHSQQVHIVHAALPGFASA